MLRSIFFFLPEIFYFSMIISTGDEEIEMNRYINGGGMGRGGRERERNKGKHGEAEVLLSFDLGVFH